MAAAAPDIASLLAGLGGGGGMGGDPQGGMMGQMGDAGVAPEAPTGGGEEESIAILKQILALIQQYREVQGDEEDRLTAAQADTLIQRLLAKDQADSEKLLGGGALSRTLRRV